MKKIIYFIMFLLMIVNVLGADCGTGYGTCVCGDTVMTDYTLPASLSCTGTRGLRAGAHNIELNCNYHAISGTNTDEGIFGQDFNNIKITNCVINNFAVGIYNRGDSWNISNNQIDSSAIGIRIRDGSYNIVSDNIISNSSNKGFYASTLSEENNITDNTFLTNKAHIVIESGANGFLFARNYLWNNTLLSSSLQIIGVINTIIKNNIVNLSGWNAYDISGNNTLLDGNSAYNSIHGDIDVLTNPTTTLDGQGGIIRYNNFTRVIGIRNHKDYQIYNNIIYTNETCISIQGNDNTNRNHTIHNNTCTNTLGGIAFHDGSTNNTWSDNTINQGYIRVENYFDATTQPNLATFNNNIFSSGINHYFFSSFAEYVNVTINESSTLYHWINWSDNEESKFIFNGEKKFNIENNTIRPYSNVDSHLYLSSELITLNGLTGGCIFPYYKYEPVGYGNKFCYGNYSINSPVWFGSHQAGIDCQDSSFYGDGTEMGIYVGWRDEVIVENCNIYNVDVYGMYLSGSDGNLIRNNSFYDTKYGVNLGDTENTTFENNTIWYNNTANSIGLRLNDDCQNNIIKGNDIQYHWDNLRMENTLVNNNTIINNIIKFAGNMGYFPSILSHNNYVINNTITNNGWNGMDLWGNSSFYYNNTIANNSHHEIDLYSSAGYDCGGYNIFDGNFFESNHTTNAIYASNSYMNNFTNNYVKNGRVAFVGNETLVYGNYIFNNTIINAHRSMFCGGIGTVFEQNTIIDPINESYYVSVTSSELYSCNFTNNIINNNVSAVLEQKVGKVYFNETNVGKINLTIGGNKFYTMSASYGANKWFNISNNSITLHCGIKEQTYVLKAGETRGELNNCSAGCEFPYDDMDIFGSHDYCKGNYYLEDTDSNGIFEISWHGFTINGNDLTINCKSGSTYGAYFNAYDVGFENMSFVGCTDGMRIIADKYNIRLKNLRFENATSNSIEVSSGVKDCTFENITSLNNSMRIDGANNITISDSYFSDRCKGFVGCDNGLQFEGLENSTIVNNTFTENLYGLYIKSNVNNHKNNLFHYNTFFYNDRGLYISKTNATNSTFENNIFKNNTANYDAYNLDIQTISSHGFNFLNNDFSMTWNVVLHSHNSTNMRFINNTINMLSYEEKASGKYRGYNGYGIDKQIPGVGVHLGQEFKGWKWGNDPDNYMGTINSNFTILDNTFDDDTQILMLLQGVENITYDITDYWFRKFEINATGGAVREPLAPYEFYNNNEHEYLKMYQLSNRGTDKDLFIVHGSDVTPSQNDNRIINFTMSKTVMTFENANQTKGYNLTLYNLSTHNTYCNSTVALCQQDVTGIITETISSGLSVFIGLSSSDDPKPKSIATTVTDFDYNYISTTKLIINYTGSGDVDITNLIVIGSNNGYYTVNGALSNTNIYSLTTPGYYLFKNTLSSDCSSNYSSMYDDFLSIITGLSLFIFCVMIVLVYSRMNNSKFTIEHSGKMIVTAGTLLIFVIALGIVIWKLILASC